MSIPSTKVHSRNQFQERGQVLTYRCRESLLGVGGPHEDSGMQNCRVGNVQAWGADGPVRTPGDSFVQAGAAGRMGGCGALASAASLTQGGPPALG